MSATLFNFIPFFSGVIAIMVFQFNIYKRSKSTFLTVLSFVFTANAMAYGYLDMGVIVMIVSIIVLIVRAVMKPDTDTWLSHVIKH